MSAVRASLAGRSILVTGATGFLGKVIVERLLRAAPEIGRIALLIRQGRTGDGAVLGAAERCEREVLTSDLFAPLARLHGDGWQAFARRRLHPVTGDVSHPRLGLSDSDHEHLAADIDVVINAAASVVFDAPIDEAVQQNTRSVQHVADFARACRSAALVHVSTAFVAGRKTGRVAEGALTPDIGLPELAAVDKVVADIDAEASAGRWDARRRRARLVQEGMSRARSLGWHDTYTYTKALGEMVLAHFRGRVPTTVIRPSIIESSLRQPFAGWLENLNVCDPLFVEYGRGRMAAFPMQVDTVFDLVPVDFVANLVLATLPELRDAPDIRYYAIGSGSLNPVTGRSLCESAFDHFTRQPMADRTGRPIEVPRLTFPSLASFRQSFSGDTRRGATARRLLYLAEIYHAYTTDSCIFDTTNTQRLIERLHPGDKTEFDMDVRSIDWCHYIRNVHIPGLRQHVLREPALASVAMGGHA